MELIVNVFVRKEDTLVTQPVSVHDIRVEDLLSKLPNEVLGELVTQLPNAVDAAYLEIGAYSNDFAIEPEDG